MANRHYTCAELQRIAHLLSTGLKPAVVAVRMGRSTESIYQAVCKYIRPGRTLERRHAEKLEARRQRIIKGFEAGLTISELARAFEVTTPAICLMLDRVGIDAETRDKMRASYDIYRI